MVRSRSRWRFLGQVRFVLLLTQMKPSFSSNQTGFSCTDPSSRLVPRTTRIGSAASFWTAGLRMGAFLAPAIDRAGDARWLDLDLDPAGAGALIVLLQIAMGQVIDVVAARVFGPIDHAALNLRPAPHVLGIDEKHGDAWIALKVLEPAAIRSTIDPEGSVL